MREESDRSGSDPQGRPAPQPALPQAVPFERKYELAGKRPVREVAQFSQPLWLADPASLTEQQKQLFGLALNIAMTSDTNENTKRAFITELQKFFNTHTLWKVTVSEILSVTPAKALEYRNALQVRGLANASVKRSICFLRRFYRILQKLGVIQLNPFDKIFCPVPNPKADEISTAPIARDELVKLLSVPTLRTWKGRRNFTMMLIALWLGLRRSEVCSLQIEHLKRNKTTNLIEFTVATKRGKQRQCELEPSVGEVVMEWIRWYRGFAAGPLFPSSKKKAAQHMKPNQFWGVVHRAALRAGIQRKEFGPTGRWRWRVSPHSFRSSCVVELINDGVPIDQVQKYVGHESPATTLHYASKAAINRQRIAATGFRRLLSETITVARMASKGR